MYKANMAERRPDVKDFSYSDDLLDELEASLSRERLGTYLDLITHDPQPGCVHDEQSTAKGGWRAKNGG